MDFLGKAFGSLNLGLPFKLEDEIEINGMPFKLFNGILKKDGSECSVFVYEEQNADIAENATSALRKLKLPGVIKHIETVVKSQTFVVCERVQKLNFDSMGLESRKFIMQYVLSALSMLESVAKCSYNGLNLDTLMLAKQTGLPVLVGFDFATFEPIMSPPTYASRYSLPVPIGESLNSPTLNTFQLGCVCEKILPELTLASVMKKAKRLSISQLASNGKVIEYLHNSLRELILEDLKRLLLLPQHELIRLCERLVRLAPELYEEVIRASILPELLKSKDPATFLANLTLIAQLHSPIDDEDLIAKFIVHNFTVMDRVVRMKLLETMPNYLPLLSNRLVQQRIMPKMGFGFTDSEAVVRKASVASTRFLVEKITNAQLNSDLLRLLSRTHSDSDPEIRALSTNILCEIAPKLDNQRVIAAALAKALKDPISSCRSAALIGVTNLKLPADVIADKLLASAAHGMLDKDVNIAEDSWRVTEYLLDEIKKASVAKGPSVNKPVKSDTLNANDNILPAPSTASKAAPAVTPVSAMPKTTKPAFGATPDSEPVSEPIGEEQEDDKWGWDDDEHISEVDDDAWGW